MVLKNQNQGECLVYLLFVGRTRQMTQDTAIGGMHQCGALYIINFIEIVYHPLGEWHIIIAKEIQPTVDDIHLR